MRIFYGKFLTENFLVNQRADATTNKLLVMIRWLGLQVRTWFREWVADGRLSIERSNAEKNTLQRLLTQWKPLCCPWPCISKPPLTNVSWVEKSLNLTRFIWEIFILVSSLEKELNPNFKGLVSFTFQMLPSNSFQIEHEFVWIYRRL